MKAKLEFDLDNPDDRMGHMRCVKATNMALMLWDIKQKIRSKLKYSNDLSEDELHQWIPLWWNHDGKYLLKTINRGIKSIWYWLPIIWKDRNWDSHYIFEIMKH